MRTWNISRQTWWAMTNLCLQLEEVHFIPRLLHRKQLFLEDQQHLMVSRGEDLKDWEERRDSQMSLRSRLEVSSVPIWIQEDNSTISHKGCQAWILRSKEMTPWAPSRLSQQLLTRRTVTKEILWMLRVWLKHKSITLHQLGVAESSHLKDLVLLWFETELNSSFQNTLWLRSLTRS